MLPIKEIASLSKALGHPARIEILQFLADRQSCFCGDIVEEIPLAQSTISQHLKVLKKAGLVQGNIEGTSVCYCINTERWKKAKALLNSFFSSISKSCC